MKRPLRKGDSSACPVASRSAVPKWSVVRTMKAETVKTGKTIRSTVENAISPMYGKKAIERFINP